MVREQLDLTQLTYDECEKILSVIQRDFHLRQLEKNRIGKMQELVMEESAAEKILLKRKNFNRRCCIRCYSRFIILFNPRVKCALCECFVCKECADRQPQGDCYTCKACQQLIELEYKSLHWFYSIVRNRFKRFGSAKVLRALYKQSLLCADVAVQQSEKRQEQKAVEAFQSQLKEIEKILGEELREASLHGKNIDASMLFKHEARLGAALQNFISNLTCLQFEDGDCGTRQTKNVEETVKMAVKNCTGLSAENLEFIEYTTQDTAQSYEVLLARAIAQKFVDDFEREETDTNRGEEERCLLEGLTRLSAMIEHLSETVSVDSETGYDSFCPAESGEYAQLDDLSPSGECIVPTHSIFVSRETRVNTGAEIFNMTLLKKFGKEADPSASPEDRDDSFLEEGAGIMLDCGVASTDWENGCCFGTPSQFSTKSEDLRYRCKTKNLCSGHQVSINSVNNDEEQVEDPNTERDFSENGFVFRRVSSGSKVRSDADLKTNNQSMDNLLSGLPRDISSDFSEVSLSSSDVSELLTLLRYHRGTEAISDRRDKGKGGRHRQSSLTDSGVQTDDLTDHFMSSSAEGSLQSMYESSDSDGLLMQLRASGEVDPRFCQEPANVTVAEGEVARVYCQVAGTPPIDVFWFRNTTKLARLFKDDILCEMKCLDGNLHCLELFIPRQHDAGQYICVAVNNVGHCVRRFRLDVTDNVNELKAPVFVKQLEDVITPEGSNVELNCLTNGYPPPQIMWYKNRKKLMNSDRVKIDDCGPDEHHLTLYCVTLDDVAEYSIVARNMVGEATSISKLTIQSKSLGDLISASSFLVTNDNNCIDSLALVPAGFEGDWPYCIQDDSIENGADNNWKLSLLASIHHQLDMMDNKLNNMTDEVQDVIVISPLDDVNNGDINDSNTLDDDDNCGDDSKDYENGARRPLTIAINGDKDLPTTDDVISPASMASQHLRQLTSPSQTNREELEWDYESLSLTGSEDGDDDFLSKHLNPLEKRREGCGKKERITVQ